MNNQIMIREMITLFAQLCVENNCAQRINRVFRILLIFTN